MEERQAFREAVCRAVARVPKGTVASYGQIAWMAGYPRRPRQVGMVLKGLPEGTDLPWHRIVSVKGYVPSRGRWWGAMLLAAGSEGRDDLVPGSVGTVCGISIK